MLFIRVFQTLAPNLMKRTLLLFLTGVFSYVSAFSQILNYPGGTITTSVTWNNYDTVYVSGEIKIESGSLTISPNTAGTAQGTYIVFLDVYGISVVGNGSLIVNGTSSENIFFTADRAEAGLSKGNKVFGETGETWKNLLFDSSTGSSTINYAVIENGTGDDYGVGGGIDIYGTSVLIENTTIRNCSTSGDGGGIIAEPVSGTVTMRNLNIYGNSAMNFGGGILANGAITLENSVINGNDAAEGDGIYINSPCTVKKTRVYNNSGDGIYVSGSGLLICSNSLFYGNITGIRLGSNSQIINCNIVNNITGINSESFNAPRVVNSILWGNNTEYTMTGTNKLEFAYSAIEGGLLGIPGEINGGNNKNLSSTNNADTGPNFADPAGYDMHVASRVAPMIDGGTTSYLGITAPSSDFENSPRTGLTDIGAYEFFYYIWTGAVSTSWATTGNWIGSPSSIPLSFSESKIVIPDGCLRYPTATGNLTLSSRSILTIEPTAKLQVTGITTVNTGCTFLLKSSANGSANFICGPGTGTTVGSFTTEMFLAGGGAPNNKWHYFTTPVDYHNIAPLTTDISNLNLLSYTETVVTTNKDQGWQWWDGYLSTTGFSQLRFKKGYNVFVSTDKIVTFKGTIWDGRDVSWSNTELSCGTSNPLENGWNLIGNPYTSVVDAEAFIFGSDLLGPDPLDRVIYFTKNNGFISYNSFTHTGTGGSRYVPALQGFFVHGKVGRTKTLRIPATARVGSTSSLYKRAEESTVEFPYLKINITDGSASLDENIVYFFNDATTSFDGLYDGYKLFPKNTAITQLYTFTNGIKYCMNGLPIPEATCSVPLKIQVGETKAYTINVLNLENLDRYKVSLIQGENKTDLKTNPAYTFSGVAGTTLDMTLEFESITTDIHDESVKSEESMKVWYKNGFVYLKTDDQGFETSTIISIYDINGNIVFTRNNSALNRGQITEIPVVLPNGIYICKVSNRLMMNSRKLVVVR